MGLLYVAETILKDGHEVRVLDLCNLDLPKVEVSEIVDEIRYYGPDFVGFSIYCARLQDDIHTIPWLNLYNIQYHIWDPYQ